MPWDENLFQYRADCDAYSRMVQHGYAALKCSALLPDAPMGVFDVHTLIPLNASAPRSDVLKKLQKLNEEKAHERNQGKVTI